MSMLYHLFFLNWWMSKKISLNRYLFFTSIFCLGIYMSVSKPSICFWKQVISIKWRNKFLIHNISLAGHRKSTYCVHIERVQLLVFLEIWVIARFWYWKSLDLPKSCCHYDLKAFCGTGYDSVLLNIIENTK